MATGAAKKTFTPEFMNRIDSSIIYDPLSRETLWKILRSAGGRLLQRMIRIPPRRTLV